MKSPSSVRENPAESMEMPFPSSQEVARLLPGFLHSLNNPLCTMVNSIAFLQEDLGDETRAPQTVRELQRTTESVVQTVAGMQLFVRDVTNMASELSVDKPLELAIRLVRPLYHMQGGRITADIEGSFARFAPPQAGHFLRAMTLLLMNTLEIMSPPPALRLQARRNGPEADTVFCCKFSLPSRLELEEVPQRFRRCEILCQKLAGRLLIQDGEVGCLQFEIRIPLPTSGVFLD